MIERSFFIEVKRTKNQPRRREVEIWWEKIELDFDRYWLLGGEKSEYLLLMYRVDHKEWQVEFRWPLPGPTTIKISWVDFEKRIRQGLLPTKKMEVRDE